MTAVVKIEEIAHSQLGASGSGRWMKCPGSPNLTNKLGSKADHSSGRAAAEGTVAHEVLSESMLKGVEPWEYAGLKMESGGWEFEVDQEMLDGVSLFFNFVKGIEAEHGTEDHTTLIEVSMSFPDHENMFGTVDYGLLVPKRKIVISDLKYGININVEPTSSQLWYYACLILLNAAATDLPDDLKDMEIELYIVQPRQPHHAGPIRKHIMNGQELMDWYNDVLIPAAKATEDPNAPLVVGEHCRFCPNKDHCPAIHADAQAINTDVDPVYLDDDELDEMLGKKVAFDKYFEKLGEVMYARALKGRKFNSMKLVKKKATRCLKDKAEAFFKEKYGADAYTTPVLKSAAQLEKLPDGKKFVARFAYTPDTGLTMASRTDKRPEIDRVNNKTLDALDDVTRDDL
jgi:hypothetical protein